MGFESSWERVKKATGMRKQSQLALFLGNSASNVTEAKKRDAFPLEWAFKLAKEYDLNTDWIMTGQSPMRREPSQAEKIREGEEKYEEPLAHMEDSLQDQQADDYGSVQFEERIEEHNSTIKILKYILKNAREEDRQRTTGWLYEMYYRVKDEDKKKNP